MISDSAPKLCGVLFSGGLDSAVVLGQLLKQRTLIQPIYVRCGMIWEEAEFAAAQRFWEQLRGPHRPLQLLNQPMADVYQNHWALTGILPPSDTAPDQDVYLPGRNVMLAFKAALWCQRNSIPRLSIGTLSSSPFSDAKPEFIKDLQNLLQQSGAPDVQLEQPFAKLAKGQVMHAGAGLPLEMTFSCLCPVGVEHCGGCNKCAERQRAFIAARRADPTTYAQRRDSKSCADLSEAS